MTRIAIILCNDARNLHSSEIDRIELGVDEPAEDISPAIHEAIQDSGWVLDVGDVIRVVEVD